jgi:superfamily II helicase
MEIDDITIENDPQASVPIQSEKKKKCHGNRKDQRFRKRCRAQGINPRKIERLIKQRKKLLNQNNQKQTTTAATAATATTNRNLNKRKHHISIQNLQVHSTIPKSTSSISVSQQPVTKKMKYTTNPITTSITTDSNIHLFNKIYRLDPSFFS